MQQRTVLWDSNTRWRILRPSLTMSCLSVLCIVVSAIFSSSVFREALRHAYGALKVPNSNGVNFQDFLLFMEEFKPKICKINYFLILCISCSQTSVCHFIQPTCPDLPQWLALPVIGVCCLVIIANNWEALE